MKKDVEFDNFLIEDECYFDVTSFILNDKSKIEEVDKNLSKAYEILKKAQNTKSKRKAKIFSERAYSISNACFDAFVYRISLEENSLIREEMLQDGLEREKRRLSKLRYFDNKGRFYNSEATKSYIKGLYNQAYDFAKSGKYKQAIKTCQNLLRLDYEDNLKIRYLTMALYATLEQVENARKLRKRYNKDKSFAMEFPLLIVYYKLSDYKKARRILNKIIKNNPKVVDFFQNKINNIFYDRKYTTELKEYFYEFSFLIEQVPNIEEFILENGRRITKKK